MPGKKVLLSLDLMDIRLAAFLLLGWICMDSTSMSSFVPLPIPLLFHLKRQRIRVLGVNGSLKM